MSDRERAIRQRLKDDFGHYAPRCLRIRTKSGAVNPLQLNRSQAYLHDALARQHATKRRVRALVLKGRQVGISTYIAGRYYWRTTHATGYRTFILAHLDDASDNLFGMARRFHDHCPPLVKPQTGAANAKELSFPGLQSGYKVSTAGSRGIGRSDTLQLFHGSEVAFWPNADEHFSGIMQALSDADGTECILESTANGIGNTFHALWKAAERGESEFEAIFIPWFWHEEYTREPPAGWSPPEAWREYAELTGITLGQTYWAYCKSRDQSVVAGGDQDDICWKFRQEYPSNADEAFQTSGAQAFISPIVVLRARKHRANGSGPMVLGVDPARGGGDRTALIDRQGRVLGKYCCRRINHADLMAVAGEVQQEAARLRPLGLKKIVIDTTGLGAGLYDRLRELMGDFVEGVNFANKALQSERYANRRAEMWDEMRQWFDNPAGVQIPDMDDLQGDICAPIRGPGATRFNSSNQLILEDKDHIKERLMHSPDLGDAAALTFAIDFWPIEVAKKKVRLGTVA